MNRRIAIAIAAVALAGMSGCAPAKDLAFFVLGDVIGSLIIGAFSGYPDIPSGPNFDAVMSEYTREVSPIRGWGRRGMCTSLFSHFEVLSKRRGVCRYVDESGQAACLASFDHAKKIIRNACGGNLDHSETGERTEEYMDAMDRIIGKHSSEGE